MLSNKVIGRYAKALFELASEKKLVEELYADMRLINQVVTNNNDFLMMLSSPIIKIDKKASVLKEIFTNKINELTLSYILLLTKKRREVYIPSIGEEVISLYREYKGIKRAFLKSAIAIDSKTRASIMSQLKKYTNKDIELVEEVQPELIGGFVLSFDNKQYDASILKQFQMLTKEFHLKENNNN